MSKPADGFTRSSDPDVRALTRDIVDASDLQIMRVIAKVDGMTNRGPADALITPLRRRLARLHPPHPLRFTRLLFLPLNPLIVPADRWRPEHNTIPRTALLAIAGQVRQSMTAQVGEIEAEIAGYTDADTDLIARVGRLCWPAAAQVLAGIGVPASWEATGLGEARWRPLADAVAVLLAQAIALDTLCAETAHGLLPPRPEAVLGMLSRVLAAHPAALPMLITLLLFQLPVTAALILEICAGPDAKAIQAAMNEATDQLLRQLDKEEGIARLVATGNLFDVAAAVSRLVTLFTQIEAAEATPRRRQALRTVRQQLDSGCKARFEVELGEALLAPLQVLAGLAETGTIAELEATARGLRVLETEARCVGNGAAYDGLLEKAAATIKGGAMRDRLAPVDQIRLVEILVGPDAALAMLDAMQ